MGDTLRATDPAGRVRKDEEAFAAIIGANRSEGLRYIVGHLVAKGHIQHGKGKYGYWLRLTLPGWDEYAQLQRANSEGPIAFMAMPFGYAELDAMFLNCFKPAADKAGFVLRRIDEKPAAGLIDDRLRVEIRKSRFLVAELAHENRGAYWEAGFAEGLGRPVIYTCQQKWWNEMKTHFDTNHHHTIVWSSDDQELAEKQLKATIRETLPEETRLTDPPSDDTQ